MPAPKYKGNFSEFRNKDTSSFNLGVKRSDNKPAKVAGGAPAPAAGDEGEDGDEGEEGGGSGDD